ncbi:tRNA (adenosine(37)-N6)-dimethylallyltransferase MiaA [Phenylobacterium aquaticum]|uniref:tRNA (adenosine(37)-N6)-dimethylallyltransferase MiaA n=1 Tax=Phenylobacterium aquaticum TaxID=1763816 RepID=UPI001F5CC1DC|nr:tRNA (adenosine(37)-N6)-dimethylallyltransferase MiaA [Phenylobacterium aquaticum]MCI3133928.1 tRNA (adenosine(37)-N6)-dimethylallyltransferase MiaA [Phenylobacterium aquaticum]
MTRRIWLIAGPTASGKSALALRLAEATGAEIIGADALQLYRDIPILSAAPSAAERARVRHHLVGEVDAAEGWSVGHWQRAALARLAEIPGSVVIVGGTGLYFRALTHGLAEVPPIPETLREAARRKVHTVLEQDFREELAQRDPLAAARISPGDKQRLARAWEVLEATGRSLSDWQADSTGALPAGSWTAVALEPPRDALYDRCDQRLEAMVEAGVLAEVEALAARRLAPALPALKAVGYREFAAHLAGETSLKSAIAAAQMETRRYAKRQTTWMRGQMADWSRITAVAPEEQWRQFIALDPGLTL